MTTKQSILSRLSEAVHGTEKDFFTQELLDKFAEYYVNEWSEETEGEEIADTFVGFYWTTEHAVRRCGECGKLMLEGYCIDSGYAYYCSDECLHKNTSEKEYLEMYEEDLAFWTEWH